MESQTMESRESLLKRRYALAASRTGVPKDQIENFTRAGIVLNPTQLKFSALTRLADKDGGPDEFGFGGAMGGGKQIKTSEIMQFWRGKIGNLEPMIKRAYEIMCGDWMIGSDGKPVRVLTKSAPEVRQFYKITFDDKSSIEVSDNHLWTVFDLSGRGEGQKERGHWRRDVETEWLFKQPLRYRDGRRFAIPIMTGPVEPTNPTEPHLPPYTLGYWLGNGCKQASTFTCHTDDVEEVKSYIAEEISDKLNIRVYEEDVKRAKILISGWSQKLQAAGWPNQWNEGKAKRYRTFLRDRICIEWRNWSSENRSKLLAGLLDSDGCVRQPGGEVEFDSKDLSLAMLVRSLMQSLGQKVTYPLAKKPKKKEWSVMYRIQCATTIQMFRLKRKAAGVNLKRELKQSRRYIVSIEKTGLEEGVCFSVDSDDHLYVAGQDYIVTHNSFGLLAQLGADDCQRYPGLKCLMLRKAAKSNLENFTDLRRRVLHNLRHYFIEKNKTLYFHNQSRIILGHFQNERDIENYLGLEYDVIAIEEATTLSPAKLKQIQTRCRTSKPNWRPRTYSNTNPGGIGHAFYRAKFILPYRNKTETVTRFVPSLPTDCPQNNAGYAAKMEASLTGWQLRAWRYGDWDIAAGQFFTTFRNEPKEAGGHIVDYFDPLKAREWLMSFDYGFKHYTVVLLAAVCEDGLYFVDEWAERLMLPRQHADGIKAMLDRYTIGGPGSQRKLKLSDIKSFVAGTDVFAKERDGKSVADDYLTHGIKLTPANMDRINGWAELMNLLGDSFAKPRPQVPRMFIHRRCARLIETLPILQHDPDRPEDVLKVDCDDDGIGGDDAADGCRYLVSTRAKDSRMIKLGGL